MKTTSTKSRSHQKRQQLRRSNERPVRSATNQLVRHASDRCLFNLVGPRHAEPAAPGEHPILEALDPAFRAQTKWHPTGNAAEGGPKHSPEVFVWMTRPGLEVNHDASDRWVACDRDQLDHDSAKEQAQQNEFWSRQINIRPFSAEFATAAGPVWDRIGLDVSLDRTAFMMGLKAIDQETARAVLAALFNTLNTSAYPVDVEATAFALASFIHAHPKLAGEPYGQRFVHPYGDRTVYRFAKTVL